MEKSSAFAGTKRYMYYWDMTVPSCSFFIYSHTHIKTLGVYFDDLSSSISKVTHAPTSFVRLRHKIKISKPTLREIVLPFSKRASDKMLFAVPSETKYYITWI
jgi:hypothetical protein